MLPFVFLELSHFALMKQRRSSRRNWEYMKDQKSARQIGCELVLIAEIMP